MTYHVFLQPTVDNGYKAIPLVFPDCVAVGKTRDEALANLRAMLSARLSQGEVVTVEVGEPEHPWLKGAGMFRGEALEDTVEMSTVTLLVPDESLAALDMTPEEAADELRLAAAVKLYELGRLSSGAAAHLAGIPRTVFLCKLADYGVSTFRQTEEELKEELASA